MADEEVQTLETQAAAKYRAAKYSEAEALLKNAYAIRKERFGEEHDDSLLCLSNLAAALGRQEKFIEARQSFERALEIRSAKLGREHCDTLLTINHYAVLLKQQGLLLEVEPLLTEALTGFTKIFGLKHLCTAEASYNYGILSVQMGKRRKAAKPFSDAYLGLKASLGEEHPHTVDANQWRIKCAEAAAQPLTPLIRGGSGGDARSKSGSLSRSGSFNFAVERDRSNTASSMSSGVDVEPTDKPELVRTTSIGGSVSFEMDTGEDSIYNSQKDWVSKKSCDLCSGAYTLFSREHHCRICSRSVCQTCSPKTTLAFEFSQTEPVRFCVQCEQQGF